MTRLLLTVPEGQIPFATAPQIVISPDGTELVYAARSQGATRLYLRPMDQFHASPIRGTEGASSPFVAPDGNWVGFFADNRLKKVPLRGGDPLTLCELEPGFIRTGTWSREGWIIFSNSASGGLQQVPAAGGAVESLGKPDVTHGELALILPEVIPGGEHVLFTSMRAGLGFGKHPVGVLSLKTKAKQILTSDVTMARLLDDEHVVGWSRGSLFVFPFDLAKSPVLGRGLRVLEGVGGGAVRRTGAFSVSAFGSLAYLADDAQRGLSRFQWASCPDGPVATTASPES